MVYWICLSPFVDQIDGMFLRKTFHVPIMYQIFEKNKVVVRPNK